MALATHFRELRVYRTAFDAAMLIFTLSKEWPAPERYSLIDQIRRSSRSVCGNIAEAWRKRRYPNHFVSKLSDADGETAETENWLEFARACGYLTQEQYQDLCDRYQTIARGLVGMMNNADSWCGPASLVREPHSDYLASPEELPQ
jgi:four helix bundle protein